MKGQRRDFYAMVLVKRGFSTGQVMVVLVTSTPVFTAKYHFVKALIREHPEITTILQNVNPYFTSLVLGKQQKVLMAPVILKIPYAVSFFGSRPRPFYQINPVQTEVLYGKAMELAGLTGKERVIDAYCGIGTIGLTASRHAREVIGVEVNGDAVRDAIAPTPSGTASATPISIREMQANLCLPWRKRGSGRTWYLWIPPEPQR